MKKSRSSCERLLKARLVLISAFAVFAVFAGASGAVLAASHGNALVHSREFRGQVYMMDQVHFSLYFFTGDETGISNCYGECALTWPPVLLDAEAQLGENYTLIERTGGAWQAAYKGRPLYRYSGDKNVGDINGKGIDGVWELAQPE